MFPNHILHRSPTPISYLDQYRSCLLAPVRADPVRLVGISLRCSTGFTMVPECCACVSTFLIFLYWQCALLRLPLAALIRRAGRACPVESGVDQHNVRERQRKIAEHASGVWIVFLGKQSDVVAQCEKCLKQRLPAWCTDPPGSAWKRTGVAGALDAVYVAVAERHPDAAVIVPPRTTAVPSGAAETAPTQRDRHLQCITEKGRMAWQRASGHNKRAKAEAAIGRWKQ
jgi:hypothetical protein